MDAFHIVVVSVVALACSACASAPSVEVPRSAPVACTLSPEELSRRRAVLLPGLIERAKEVVDIENGLRLMFEDGPRLLADLVRIVEQERTCCSFLRFKIVVEPGNGPVVFEVSGPPGTREMLRAL